MIKLNNKNITYVALADSNNSLKAPKEIWYADSSNSVKLVYRRKDALIEGEDYEKYHWLDGDGSAYIDTLVSDLTNVDTVTCHFYWYEDVSSNNRIFGRESPKSFACAVNFSVSKLSIWIESPYIQLNLNNGEDYFEVDLVNQKISTSLQTRWISPITEIIGTSFYLFGDNGYNKIFSGKIKSFIIGDKLNLIPCKLLKPVPKWLDANGIRRQIGECGMIDLVSGKFYGNVNNVGTFTVENYYERKEWLVGDGEAYIDVLRSNEVTDVIHFKVDTSNSGSEGVRGIFGNKLETGVGNTIYFVKYNSGYMACRAFNSGNEVRPVRYNVMSVDMLMDSVKVNSDTYELNRDITALEGYSMPIFSRRRINAETTNITKEIITASLAYFKIDNVLDLIPCTLTMDLPASMDANNIARTKGTSGMWDLVSDKFYGNVASSGTFKAVNLAEGVDYEVYDWLVGDGSAYIQGIEYDLWNNHLQMRIGKVREELSPIYYINYHDSASVSYLIVRLTYYAVVENNILNVIFRENATSGHIANIAPYSSMNEYVDFDFYIDNTEPICERDGVIFTNSSTNIATQSSWTSIQPRIYSAKMSYIREVLPNDTYRSNLIPCKLLRSIPSKYDANGIARQAGECGMYDTVNDVFYGNVASSGSFTVSDDN